MRPRRLSFEELPGCGRAACARCPPSFPPAVRARVARVYRHLGLSCAVTVRAVVFVVGVPSAWGQTEGKGDHYLVQVVDGLSPRQAEEVLAHEFRHVWQFESGRLHVHVPPREPEGPAWSARWAASAPCWWRAVHWRWCGGPWLPDQEWPPYRSLPWEVDAYAFSEEWLRSNPVQPAVERSES